MGTFLTNIEDCTSFEAELHEIFLAIEYVREKIGEIFDLKLTLS